MKLFQSLGVFVFAPDSKCVGAVPRLLRSTTLLVSVTKSTLEVFGSRFKTISARPSKLSGIDTRDWSVTGSTLASKLCNNFALSILTGMPSAVARGKGTGPRGYESVTCKSMLCSTDELIENVLFCFNLQHFILRAFHFLHNPHIGERFQPF